MTKRPPPQNQETFHKARSRLVDAFARLEEWIALALRSEGKPVKGDTLATKLKTLRSLPGYSDRTDIDFDRLSELVQFRADLVHGSMAFLDRDGERLACFRNARNAVLTIQPASLVSYKTMKDMSDEIDRLTLNLAKG